MIICIYRSVSMHVCLSKLWYQFICKWCVWWWWWWWWCFYNEGSIRPDKVCCAVEKLATSKACAPEGISQVCQQNNLSFTSFGGFLVHILLPYSMLTILHVPIVKYKTGKIEKHMPISLDSVLSKILAQICSDGLQEYKSTTDSQLGSKNKHDSDLCIYNLKGVV